MNLLYRNSLLSFSGFLIMCLLSLSSTAQSDVTITVTHKEASYGSRILVPVTTPTGIPQFQVMELHIGHDPGILQYIRVTNLHPNLTPGTRISHIDGNTIKIDFADYNDSRTLPDGAKLFDLEFDYCLDLPACLENGGSTMLQFTGGSEKNYVNYYDLGNRKWIFHNLTLNNGSVYSNESLYTLTIEKLGQGHVNVDGDAYTEPIPFIGGSEVSLSAVAGTDWRFLQWSGDLTGNDNPADLLMNGNKTVTAEFTDEPFPQAVLTINKTGNGTVRVNGVAYTEPLSFDEGTEVTLTAEPDEGHEFTGWGGDLSGSDSPQILVMNADKNVDATFSIKRYTLTINTSGNGSGSVLVDGVPYTPPLVVDHGTTMELQAVPGEFSNFGGWSGALGSTTNPQSITMDDNKIVTASFPLKQYTLTINTNGSGSVRIDGASYTDPITLNHGDNPSIQAFQATGWDFTGWSDDLSGTDNPQNLLMDGNKTVTANFTIKQYTLTIETIGEGTVLVNDVPYTEPITYNHGSTPTLHAIPDENYRFDNWSGDLDGNTTPKTLLMNGNKTVTANFSLKQYTLTIHASTGGSVTVNEATYSNPIVFDHGSTPTLEAIPNAFHHFDGWSGNLTSTTNPQQISMTENRVVYATFSPFQYTLTIETSGSGSVLVDDTPYPGQITFSHGDTPILQANGDEGWRFSFWSNDLAGSTNPVTLLMDGNKNITAHFELRQYTLTINELGEGSVLVDGVSYNNPMVFTHGDTPALMAIPEEYHSFDGWEGNLDGMINPQNIFMDGNKTVDAFFSPFQYTLEVAVDELGHVKVDGVPYTTPRVFDHGQTPTLAAYASEDWQFDGWSGDLSGTLNPQSLLMDGNKKVTAHFSAIPPEFYTLTVAIYGGGSVLVNDQMYTSPQGHGEGSELTLMAVPDQGWTFSGWSGDVTGTEAQVTLQMDDDKEVFATFVREEYTLTVNYSGQGEVLVNGDLYVAPVVFSYEDMPAIEAIPGEGWLFEGWSGDLTNVDNPTTMLVDGNKTITANFALKQYTLTIETQGAGSLLVDGIPYTNTLSFSHGVTIDLQAIPEEGWDFESWQGDLHSSENPAKLLMDNDKEITALFAIRQYNLTVETVGQGNVTIDGATYTQTLALDHGDSPVLHAEADEGWLFEGWTGDITGDENPITLHMDGVKVVTAVFVEIPPDTFTLTITPFGKGSVKVNDTDYITPMTFSEGTILNLEAMPDEGWFFDGWELDLGGDQNPAELLMDSDKTVAAFFLETPPSNYTLTLSTTGEGTVEVNDTEYNEPLFFKEGTVVDLIAIPAEGWEFAGWEGDLSGTENPATLVMDGNKDITALFEEIPKVTYLLTIVTIGQGKVLVNDTEYTEEILVEEGSLLTIEAIPDDGWQFDSWNTHLTGNENPTTLLMDDDKIVDVRFSEKQDTFSITFVVGKEDGTPITDALIQLNDHTNHEGNYVFQNLETGNYNYSVNKAGYHEKTGFIELIDTDIVETVILAVDDVSISDRETPGIRAYPIPANNILYIHTDQEPIDLHVIDITGKIILSSLASPSNIQEVDISSLPSGTYFVRLRTINQSHTLIFQVKK